MLKRENRLRKKKDFDAIFKQGDFKKTSFIFFITKKNNLEYSRFGIIVNKKVSKKAVIRNKIKRRIREIIRKKENEMTKGLDVIIMPYKEIKTKLFQEIEQEIEWGLNKLKIKKLKHGNF